METLKGTQACERRTNLGSIRRHGVLRPCEDLLKALESTKGGEFENLERPQEE